MFKIIKNKTIFIFSTVLAFIMSAEVAFADGLVVSCWREGHEYYNDVSCLLLQAIKIGEFVFSIIGAVAFVMFIYGGFTIILSFGNAEKVKKGQGIFVAAVVGLLIAFGAYVLIGFILDALGVGAEFRGVR